MPVRVFDLDCCRTCRPRAVAWILMVACSLSASPAVCRRGLLRPLLGLLRPPPRLLRPPLGLLGSTRAGIAILIAVQSVRNLMTVSVRACIRRRRLVPLTLINSPKLAQ